jgi:YD repeat-containing protein
LPSVALNENARTVLVKRYLRRGLDGQPVETIEEMGYQARPMPGAQRTAIGLVGNDGRVDATRLAALTDPKGRVTRFEHDNVGRVVAVEHPVGGRDSYAYDGLDRLIRFTDTVW